MRYKILAFAVIMMLSGCRACASPPVDVISDGVYVRPSTLSGPGADTVYGDADEMIPNETACYGNVLISDEAARADKSDSEAWMDTVFASGYAQGDLIGRVCVPSLGIDTGLYFSYDGAASQAIVDLPDSAVCIPSKKYSDGSGFVGPLVIGDHVNQGFDAMKLSVPYETMLYITDGNGAYPFLCTGIDFNGINSGESGTLILSDGSTLYDKGSYELYLYTCNAGTNGVSVTVTSWTPVSE